MNTTKSLTIPLLAAIGCASLNTALAGSQSDTGTVPPIEILASPKSGWEFRIEPYIWLPSLKGTVGNRGKTTDIDLDLSDLFSGDGSGNALYDIETYFGMQLEARNGRWGVLASTVYLDLNISGTAPTSRHLFADVDYKELLGDLVVTYRLADSPTRFLDVYAGARVNSISLDINAQADLFNFSLERDIRDTADETWVDPVIGLRGQWAISENFFIAGKADIGGFGVNSDFLWSAQGTLGYQFTDWFTTEIGYSFYDTDYQNDDFIYDMAMGGLFLGFNFEL